MDEVLRVIAVVGLVAQVLAWLAVAVVSIRCMVLDLWSNDDDEPEYSESGGPW